MYTIRKLDAKKDFEKTKALFKETFSLPPWKDDWSDERQLALYIDDLISQKNALCLGFFDDELLIGLALGRIMHFYLGTQFRIDEFCITNRQQGKGLGTSFFDQIKEFCRKRGIQDLLLDTTRSFPAYRFYLKNGFEEIPDNVSLLCHLK